MKILATLVLALCFTACGSQAQKDLDAYYAAFHAKYQRQNDCLKLEIAMRKNHMTDHQIAEYERDHNIQVGCIE